MRPILWTEWPTGGALEGLATGKRGQ